MIASRRKRTRYGTRTVHYGRCSVPDCDWKGDGHYKRSLAKADEQRHYRQAHPQGGEAT